MYSIYLGSLPPNTSKVEVSEFLKSLGLKDFKFKGKIKELIKKYIVVTFKRKRDYDFLLRSSLVYKGSKLRIEPFVTGELKKNIDIGLRQRRIYFKCFFEDIPSDSEIKLFFEKYGKVETAYVNKSSYDKDFQFGFVTFLSTGPAQQLVQKGSLLFGRSASLMEIRPFGKEGKSRNDQTDVGGSGNQEGGVLDRPLEGDPQRYRGNNQSLDEPKLTQEAPKPSALVEQAGGRVLFSRPGEGVGPVQLTRSSHQHQDPGLKRTSFYGGSESKSPGVRHGLSTSVQQPQGRILLPAAGHQPTIRRTHFQGIRQPQQQEQQENHQRTPQAFSTQVNHPLWRQQHQQRFFGIHESPGARPVARANQGQLTGGLPATSPNFLRNRVPVGAPATTNLQFSYLGRNERSGPITIQQPQGPSQNRQDIIQRSPLGHPLEEAQPVILHGYVDRAEQLRRVNYCRPLLFENREGKRSFDLFQSLKIHRLRYDHRKNNLGFKKEHRGSLETSPTRRNARKALPKRTARRRL